MEVGVKFVISFGMIVDLFKVGMDVEILFIFGILFIFDLMKGKDVGYIYMKFFLVEVLGGVKVIKLISGLFFDVIFCLMGGIGFNNYNDYFVLNNVKCVGGFWLVLDDVIEVGDWVCIM